MPGIASHNILHRVLAAVFTNRSQDRGERAWSLDMTFQLPIRSYPIRGQEMTGWLIVGVRQGRFRSNRVHQMISCLAGGLRVILLRQLVHDFLPHTARCRVPPSSPKGDFNPVPEPSGNALGS